MSWNFPGLSIWDKTLYLWENRVVPKEFFHYFIRKPEGYLGLPEKYEVGGGELNVYTLLGGGGV